MTCVPPVLRGLAVSCIAVLTGCASTEPVTSLPHVNLSPEDMSFAGPGDRGQLDFGLDVTRNESDSLENLAALPGLRVRSVRNGSAAERAGIRSGDVILAVQDVETNQPDALAALAQAGEGESFRVRARRGTTVYETSMERPSQRRRTTPEELYRADPVRTRAGYRTELASLDGGEQRTVARIEKLSPQSPLAAAGLKEGDVLVALDGNGIETAQGLVNQLHRREPGQTVNFTVIAESERKPHRETVEVRLWQPERRLTSLVFWPLFRYESSLASERVKFSLLDFVLFSVFSYESEQNEKTYRLLGLLEFGSGYGELIEEGP